MLNLFYQNPWEFFIVAILLIIAIGIHEFAHAATADYLGDPTPRIQGRLTLNPFHHLDPLGSLFLLFFGFGWGKPVPIDPFNLRNPKKDTALISFAGPFSNILMAISASFLYKFLDAIPLLIPGIIGHILIQFMYFNILLGVFNLLPIHPLDGFKVVAGLLPKKYYQDWLELENYGFLFLLLLLFPFFGKPAVFSLISPVINFFFSLLLPIKGGGFI